MIIVINALAAHTGGGVSQLINLLPAIDKTDKRNKYIILLSSVQKSVINAIPERFAKVFVPFNSRNIYIKVFFEQIILPIYLLLLKADLLYSAGNIISIFSPCKVVLLIENANTYSHLNIEWSFRQRFRQRIIKMLGFLSARRANKIRFISRNSRDILCKSLNIPMEKTVVIPHGWDPKILDNCEDFDDLSLPSEYILMVGDIYPHKNIHSLMDAYELLVDKYGYNGSLVIVGAPLQEDYVAKLIDKKANLKNGSKIVFTGKIEYRKVMRFYQHAHVFVLPSIEETFGLPLIEAMGCGVPVVAADCSTLDGVYFNPFKEICGDAAHYFDPFDHRDMMEGIYRVISDVSYRQRLILGGLAQVKKYDLGEIAKSLQQLFENM